MTEPESDPLDELAMLRAQLDQAIALAPELARCARGYFDAFAECGFSEKQALYLAAAQMLQDPGSAPA